MNEIVFKRPRGRPPKNPMVKQMEQTDALRPPVRDEDPRAAAARRAAELRAHGSAIEETTDKFYIPREIIPDGWEYNWKRHTVYGQEDPSYQIQLAREGWTAVPRSRHPDMMPYGSNSEIIFRDGQILMECPMEICEERRLQELRAARNQVRAKEAQLAGTPENTFTRDDPRVAPKIKKGYSPLAIPE